MLHLYLASATLSPDSNLAMGHELPRYDRSFQPKKGGRFDRFRSNPNKNGLLLMVIVAVFMLFYLFSSFKGDTFSLQEVVSATSDPRSSLEPVRFLQKLKKHSHVKYDESSNLEYYDLNDFGGSADGASREQYVLLCIPLRNAAEVLPMMYSHINNLTYPHHLIDIAFLISDTSDTTIEDLYTLTEKYSFTEQFNSVTIMEKDFGQIVGQGFDDRHGVAVQGQRRKLMGRARNWLLSANLKPYHSWVYWRDADIELSPPTIIEDLMKHDADVIVPNVWRPLPDWLGGEQPYDLNAWQESQAAIDLAKTLDEDDVIVEGYAEYPTWRPHMAYFRSPNGDQDETMDLDGIGGVSILARARVFREGANFPGFALWNHAETEAFGKMCRKMGFSVKGKVHYTVWHLYEPSEEDLKTMKEMEAKAKLKTVSQVDDSKI